MDERVSKVDERVSKVDERVSKVDERVSKVDESSSNSPLLACSPAPSSPIPQLINSAGNDKVYIRSHLCLAKIEYQT